MRIWRAFSFSHIPIVCLAMGWPSLSLIFHQVGKNFPILFIWHKLHPELATVHFN